MSRVIVFVLVSLTLTGMFIGLMFLEAKNDIELGIKIAMSPLPSQVEFEGEKLSKMDYETKRASVINKIESKSVKSFQDWKKDIKQFNEILQIEQKRCDKVVWKGNANITLERALDLVKQSSCSE